jgi:hypothetical protein
MDQVQKRLDEIKQKQLQMQESIQAARSKASSKDKSHLVTALMGIAAGITIAVIAWLTNSLLLTKDAGTSAWDLPSTILGKENSKTDERIDQLHDRVELLAESVSRLEIRFDQFMESANTSGGGTEQSSSTHMDIPEDHSDNTVELDTSGITNSQQEAEITFVPTHTVKTRLNLRPSTSLDEAPIALLDAGTKVRYIDEEDGWYYVDTESHGQGWCASEYLSPLQENQ